MNDYQAPLALLHNRVILITGAGDGIGKVAALTYGALGATCILLGRTVKKLEATYDELVTAGAPEPAIVPLDLNGASPKHYADMAHTIDDQFGRLDGILHNASVLGHLSPMAHIPPDEWNEVMQINVNSAFYLTQAMLPLLKRAPSASVIFTSSSVGRTGRANWGTYAVSKFATEGMMQVFAAEHQNTGVRFNCINPGATRTAMRAKAFPAEDPQTLKTATQIMPMYCYLMGDDSATVNGQSLDCQPKPQ